MLGAQSTQSQGTFGAQRLSSRPEPAPLQKRADDGRPGKSSLGPVPGYRRKEVSVEWKTLRGGPASGRTPQRYSTICLDLATTKENQQWERSHLGLDRDYGETAPPLDWKGTERGAASRTLCSCRRVGKSSAEIITADARPERGGPACRALDPVTSHPPGTAQRLRGRRRESDLKA